MKTLLRDTRTLLFIYPADNPLTHRCEVGLTADMDVALQFPADSPLTPGNVERALRWVRANGYDVETVQVTEPKGAL